MPKRTHTINMFHGGIDSNTDPRDIGDNQFSDMQDVAIDSAGRIKLMGALDYGDASNNATGTLVAGHGLLTIGSDRKVSDGSESDEYIYLNADGGQSIDVKDSDGWISEGASTENIASPAYFHADGNVRIGDSSFAIGNQFFGYISRTVFGGTNSATTTGTWVKRNASISKPVSGKCLISTPFNGDDDTGGQVNSTNGEYYGTVAESGVGLDDVISLNTVNLRVGISHSGSVKTDGTPINGGSTDMTLTGDNGGTYDLHDFDGSYVDIEDVWALFFNHNVLVGGLVATTGANGATTKITCTPANLSYTINTDKSFLIGIYFWEVERARVASVDVRCGLDDGAGVSSSNYRFWTVDGKDLIEGWNVIVCEAGGNSGDHGSPPAYGATHDWFQVLVSQINPTNGNSTTPAPRFYISGPVVIDNPSTVGYRPGEYSFHSSYLYDDIKQESLLTKLGDIDSGATPKELSNVKTHLGNCMFIYDMYISPKSTGTYGPNERITGNRVYYKKKEDDNYYLIAEVDYEANGVQFFPEAIRTEDTFYSFANTHYNSNMMVSAVVAKNILSDSANVVDTYRSLNGFFTAVGSIDARFKTGVIHGRRAYVGNIKQGGIKFPDRMLKSMVNRFDTFPDTDSVVDVAIRDGENVIKLEAFADRVLQFKEKTLYVINVAEGSEFLEETYRHKGILYPAHSTLTDIGVAWFNKNGVYFYDGNSVINLLAPKGQYVISESAWESFITSSDTATAYAMIGYIPKKHQIIIKNRVGGVHIYDLLMKAWTVGENGRFNAVDENVTNFALTDSNDLFLIGGTASKSFVWQTEPQESDAFYFVTKDIHFGDPSVRKKICKVHVTYKTGGKYPNVNIKYDTNGGTSYNKLFSDGTNYTTGSISSYQSLVASSSWATAIIRPATSSEANNVYSFALKLSVGTCARGTAQAGASGNITLSAGDSSADNFYSDQMILLTGGTGAGQVRTVGTYTNSSKVAAISPSWTVNPTSDSTYAIGVVPSGFEINDITVIYRTKTVT